MIIQPFVFELRLLQFCMFAHFPLLRYRQKHFRNIKIGKKLKIDILFENDCPFMKEYEFRHILSPVLRIYRLYLLKQSWVRKTKKHIRNVVYLKNVDAE